MQLSMFLEQARGHRLFAFYHLAAYTGTLEIYTHEDRQAQRQALGRISEALGHGSEPPTADTADRE